MSHYQAIVMGVSVGGMAALSGLLPNFPAEFPVPLIIVQHRSKDNGSFLEQHLDSLCKLQVLEAEANDTIHAGKVYLAPAGYHLMIEAEAVFSLSVDAPVSYAIPSVDVLFESAADVYRDKLIGIVLTGANADGSAGLKTIRNLGGLAVVQDPQTAEDPSMPQNAIRLAGADHILALDKIADFLVTLCGNN